MSKKSEDTFQDVAEPLLKGFAEECKKPAFIKKIFADPSLTDTRQFLELLRKFSDDPDKKKQSLLEESLNHLPDETNIMEQLTVCKAEIKRLLSQIHNERSRLDALFEFIKGRDDRPWQFIIRMIFNIDAFYRRYYFERNCRYVDPERWVRIMAEELGLGPELNDDWEEWQLLKKPENLDARNLFIPIEVRTLEGTLRFSYDEDGCVSVREIIDDDNGISEDGEDGEVAKENLLETSSQ